MGETAPSNELTNVVWKHISSLEELKINLNLDINIISLDSHFKDGTSSTEAMALVADMYMSEQTNPKLQVKSHCKKPQQRYFISRRWREIKEESKGWDL
jgi:hypothetical protein